MGEAFSDLSFSGGYGILMKGWKLGKTSEIQPILRLGSPTGQLWG